MAGVAALGVHLVLSGTGPTPAAPARRRLRSPLAADSPFAAWLRRSGMESVSPTRFVGISGLVGLLAALAVMAVVGPGLAGVLLGAAAALLPSAMWRRRRQAAAESARDGWPRLIEEVRVLVGSVGRPIPQALLEAGAKGPEGMRPAFAAAQREWALTTDFERTVAVLKDRLDDATADATCETLLIAQEVGGDIDARLAALAEDRRVDLRDRKEATARLAGARLARWFVVIVPAGMGFVGLRIGDGAESFRSLGGQVAAGTAVALIAVCWWWAGRIMRMPAERRVFDR